MPKTNYHIKINPEGIWVNDEPLDIEHYGVDVNASLKAIYKFLNVDYSKFYKMDNLSKLGFLGVELLKKYKDLSTYNDDEIALHFQNSVSSLDTDIQHQNKLNNGDSSSPAIFVYTLPNIVIGEIAIRNTWFGENLFILADKFDYTQWMETNELLFLNKKASAVVGGWVELLGEDFDLNLYLVEKE